MDCVAESMLETVSKQDACEHMDIAARGAAAIAYIGRFLYTSAPSMCVDYIFTAGPDTVCRWHQSSSC